MRTWQDSAAWWVCDISPAMGTMAAQWASSFYFLQDFEESATYFAEVIAFGNEYDPDYVASHRICAVMTSHTIVFAALGGAMVLLMIPPVAIAVAEILASAIGLLCSAYAVEAAAAT